MARHLLGIDVGTTGTKSMLVREDGQVVAHAYAGYPIANPGPGRSEQSAQDWWRAVVQTAREVSARMGRGDQVVALSLSTQGGTMVPVDGQGLPLRPAIVWSDTRCAAQRAAFISRFGEARMYHASGWNLGKGLNALQIAWVRENEPEVFRQARYFLSVPDFLSFHLTGACHVDMSNAGINQLADIQKKAYDPELLSFAGVDASQLAELADSGQPLGYLTDEAAWELGIGGKVLLVAGAHDQYAACLGAGMTGPGDAMIGSGTAWVVTALNATPDFSRGFSQSRSTLDGLWGSLVSLSTGGVSLDWLMQHIIGPEPAPEKPDYDRINREVSRLKAGADGLMFFPYFGSAGIPVPPADWHAGFLGMDLSHNRYHLARAVMEGVACHIAWVLEQFPGVGDGPVVLSGGAGKSAPWRQLLADLLDRPLRIPATPDLPCVGAAVLAGVGGGVFPDVRQALERMGSAAALVNPIPENVEAYCPYQALYRRRAEGLAALYSE